MGPGDHHSAPRNAELNGHDDAAASAGTQWPMNAAWRCKLERKVRHMMYGTCTRFHLDCMPPAASPSPSGKADLGTPCIGITLLPY